jgi:flavin-binding protein dodecin
MQNEEQHALAAAIAQANDSRRAMVVFDSEGRGMLLHHFTGQAMQALIEPGRLSPRTAFNEHTADEAVRIANETVSAIERFYSLAITRTHGRG